MCTDSLNAYYDPNVNGGTQNFWNNIQNTMKFYDGSVGDFVEIQRKLAENFFHKKTFFYSGVLEVAWYV